MSRASHRYLRCCHTVAVWSYMFTSTLAHFGSSVSATSSSPYFGSFCVKYEIVRLGFALLLRDSDSHRCDYQERPDFPQHSALHFYLPCHRNGVTATNRGYSKGDKVADCAAKMELLRLQCKRAPASERATVCGIAITSGVLTKARRSWRQR